MFDQKNGQANAAATMGDTTQLLYLLLFKQISEDCGQIKQCNRLEVERLFSDGAISMTTPFHDPANMTLFGKKRSDTQAYLFVGEGAVGKKDVFVGIALSRTYFPEGNLFVVSRADFKKLLLDHPEAG